MEVEILSHATTTYQSPFVYKETECLYPLEEEDKFLQSAFLDVHSPVYYHLLNTACVYITCWVVRKMLCVVQCDKCRYLLVDSKSLSAQRTDFLHLHLKQQGEVLVPSSDFVSVITTAERFLRNLFNGNMYPRQLLRELQYIELKEIGLNVFSTEHVF
ncbi:hypothetical protein ACF0H5_015983 [Mactra antiquata]